MTDFRCTIYDQTGHNALRNEGWQDISSKQMDAILRGLNDAGLLLTAERLNAIADVIEANKAHTADTSMHLGLDCAAAIVRHSMPAVTL